MTDKTIKMYKIVNNVRFAYNSDLTNNNKKTIFKTVAANRKKILLEIYKH